MSRLEATFYLRGTQVSVHLSTLLPVIWAAVGGHLGKFTLLVGVLLTHELAHLLVIYGYGLSLTRIVLLPIGARMEISGLSQRMDLEAPISLAGPVNNFFLLGMGLLAGSLGLAEGQLWEFFIAANLALAMLNLIPALPLDGGRLLRSYLGQTIGLAPAGKVMAHWGMYWGVGLIAVAAYAAVQHNIFLWVLCVLGGLLMSYSRREKNELSLESLGNLYTRREAAQERDQPPPVEHVSAYCSETVLAVSRRLGRYGYAVVWVLDQNMNLMGTLSEEKLRQAISDGRADESLGQLLNK